MASYQYGTSPRKLQPEKTQAKKKTTTKKVTTKVAKKTKKKSKYNYKPIVYIALGFIMLFVISYRNSLINENYNKKEEIKAQVSAVQKENEQLKVNIENSLNLNAIEKVAEEKLGMKKLDNSQKVYVDLQKKDYIEPATEEIVIEENKSFFSKILEKISELFK